MRWQQCAIGKFVASYDSDLPHCLIALENGQERPSVRGSCDLDLPVPERGLCQFPAGYLARNATKLRIKHQVVGCRRVGRGAGRRLCPLTDKHAENARLFYEAHGAGFHAFALQNDIFSYDRRSSRRLPA